MPVYTLQINGREYKADVAADTPLLWVLRDNLGLLGTKFGCGIAQCGACSILMNGNVMKACVLPVASVKTAAMYNNASERSGEADFIIAKHRNGQTKTVTVAFQGHYSRFVDMQH